MEPVGLTRTGLVLFIVGIVFGFSLTFLFSTTMQWDNGTLYVNRASYVNSYIPPRPEEHLHTADDRGPDESVNWMDKSFHSHAGESDEEAKLLAKRVRVLCWVMTNPSNIESKAKHVKATWGHRCNTLIFMSSQENKELPAVALPVNEGRNSLWAKTKEAFKYIYKNHMNDAEWFMKADDDTYVIVENLRHFLKDKNFEKPIYYGRKFKPYVNQGYMSGGAGYVLSKKALKLLIEKGIGDSLTCRADGGGAEDLEMGKCMERIGVFAGDSRDEMGRETFMPFVPEHHLIPGILPKDMWYWSYSFYSPKQGPDCCSDYAITFHYVTPNLMYIMEYLVYHLKPYGYNTAGSCPQPRGDHSVRTETKISSEKKTATEKTQLQTTVASTKQNKVTTKATYHKPTEKTSDKQVPVHVGVQNVKTDVSNMNKMVYAKLNQIADYLKQPLDNDLLSKISKAKHAVES